MANPLIHKITPQGNNLVLQGDGVLTITVPYDGPPIVTETGSLKLVADTLKTGFESLVAAMKALPAGAAGGTGTGTTPPAGGTGGTTAPPAGTPGGWPPVIAANTTAKVPAGSFTGSIHVDQPMTIAGAGMRKTTVDGQKGAGGGHRLAWGKGIVHVGAPLTVQDIGFFNGGGGDAVSDAEAAIYAEGFDGKVTLLRLAIDGSENGVFMPNIAGAPIDLVIDSCVFGRLSANGLNDGRSHDFYLSGRSVTVRKSIFAGNSRGNTMKCRGPKLDVSDSWIGRTNGRWIDTPGGADVTSTGSTYVSLPGGNVQNAFGFWDEADDSANPGKPGSFLSDGDTFYFNRFQEVIWINNPAAHVEFRNTKVFWTGDKPPIVVIQGPGKLTGDNPFKFDASNKVPSPSMPADPT